MAFSDFTYPDVLAALALTERTVPDLFATVPPVPVPADLTARLRRYELLALSNNTEKARAEWLIAPLLADLWERYAGTVSLYSGVTFAADPPTGLTGYCDFLLGRGPQRQPVTAPILVVFEAKNENVYAGFGQCIAGMVGALRFNRRHATGVDTVFGCSTIGTMWRFLSLTGTHLSIDLREYHLIEVDRIFGILTHMLGPLPVPAAA